MDEMPGVEVAGFEPRVQPVRAAQKRVAAARATWRIGKLIFMMLYSPDTSDSDDVVYVHVQKMVVHVALAESRK